MWETKFSIQTSWKYFILSKTCLSFPSWYTVPWTCYEGLCIHTQQRQPLHTHSPALPFGTFAQALKPENVLGGGECLLEPINIFWINNGPRKSSVERDKNLVLTPFWLCSLPGVHHCKKLLSSLWNFVSSSIILGMVTLVSHSQWPPKLVRLLLAASKRKPTKSEAIQTLIISHNKMSKGRWCSSSWMAGLWGSLSTGLLMAASHPLMTVLNTKRIP